MADIISTDAVREIAKLARLELTADEVESMRVDLSAILASMDALRSLDTDGVQPMTHAVASVDGLRADVASSSMAIDGILSRAPRRSDDFFVVPSSLVNSRDDSAGGES